MIKNEPTRVDCGERVFLKGKEEQIVKKVTTKHLKHVNKSNFYRTQVSLVRSMDPSLSHWLTDVWFNLTDVSLADEDTN